MNNNVDNDNNNLEQQIKSSLDQQLGQLDRQALSRLQQVRRQALEQAAPRAGEVTWRKVFISALKPRFFRLVVPQWSAATWSRLCLGLVLAGSVLLYWSQEPGGVSQEALPEDVLMSNEEIEFLNNLEIYEWLVAEYS